MLLELNDPSKNDKNTFKTNEKDAFFSKMNKQSSSLNFRFSKKETHHRKSK